MTREQIREAVARGWCSPPNESKVMDADLAEAIVEEVFQVFQADTSSPSLRARLRALGVVEEVCSVNASAWSRRRP